jgi:hypothetical protein
LKIKAAIIVLSFAACLTLLVAARIAVNDNYAIHKVDFFEGKDGWANFRFENLVLNADSTRLLLVSPEISCRLESPVLKTVFAFNEILLSWNCRMDKSGGLFFILSVSPDDKQWYDFDYQRWGNADFGSFVNHAPPMKIINVGWLDVDIIRLSKPMKYYKFSLIAVADTNGQFLLDRIAACYSDIKANIRQYRKYRYAGDSIDNIALAVPYRSQHTLPDSIAGRTCSPSSVTMVLNYYGRDFSHLEVSELVYDETNDIYGNWLYNVQAAYLLGMKKTWVGRHSSFAELMPELSEGKPVVISIAVKEGQHLSGAPYAQTEGHLITVRGFDGKGHVLVNDPAGNDISDGMIAYDIEELTAVWTGHQGVAYHLWQE